MTVPVLAEKGPSKKAAEVAKVTAAKKVTPSAKTASSRAGKIARVTAPEPPYAQIAPTKTVQMNTRIDAGIKAAGDRAFSRLGYTPSQVVRIIWNFAARHENDPQALHEYLDAANNEFSPDLHDHAERHNALYEEWGLLDEAYHELGITLHTPEDDAERMAYYDELREEALWERLNEREIL